MPKFQPQRGGEKIRGAYYLPFFLRAYISGIYDCLFHGEISCIQLLNTTIPSLPEDKGIITDI